jgi:hypothetical protein
MLTPHWQHQFAWGSAPFSPAVTLMGKPPPLAVRLEPALPFRR